MAVTNDNRSLGEMFGELSREIRTLVHQEIQLARTELTEKVAQLGKGVGFVIGGGLVAYGGLLAIIAAIVLALHAMGLPAWAAALLGGILVAGAGYLLIRSGLAALRPDQLTPRQTIDTLKEDAQWLRSQTK
jgi:Putative Actinobacterial Holin-X, holin superfamily III